MQFSLILRSIIDNLLFYFNIFTYWFDLLIKRNIFCIFALLPGTIAIVYYFSRVRPQINSLRGQEPNPNRLKQLLKYLWDKMKALWVRLKVFIKIQPSELLKSESQLPTPSAPAEMINKQTVSQYLDSAFGVQAKVDQYHSGLFTVLISALLLTLVLWVPASLSLPAKHGLGGNHDVQINALIYAAYGAYIYSMIMLVARVNSFAVTSKFLINAAIRAVIAMLLGYMTAFSLIPSHASSPESSANKVEFKSAESTGKIDKLTDNDSLVGADSNSHTTIMMTAFLIGLFPTWALEAVRQKAKILFKPAEPGCDVFPLCLVDGLDGAVIDFLEETGIADVQHLATADLAAIRLKTFYPAPQIADWIDQALLIYYVKKNIVAFRGQGIHGAIDLAVLYGDLSDNMKSEEPLPDRQLRAKNIIRKLAENTDMYEDSILAISRCLYEDERVRQIWYYWQQGTTSSNAALTPST